MVTEVSRGALIVMLVGLVLMIGGPFSALVGAATVTGGAFRQPVDACLRDADLAPATSSGLTTDDFSRGEMHVLPTIGIKCVYSRDGQTVVTGRTMWLHTWLV